MKKSPIKSSKISFKEFIEKYARVIPEGERIKLTPSQHAFIDFIEKNKGRKIMWLKSKSGGVNYIIKLYKEYVDQNIE
jgi:hypothetical protein